MQRFQIGEVIGLLESTNEVQIRDMYNKVVITIPLNNISAIQYMPVIGDIVLYINISDKIYNIVKIWNIEVNNLIRQGDSPLQSGELQLMGILGQYIYLNKKGTIKFVDSTMLNQFELSVNGLIAKLKKFQIDTYDGINITIDKDIVISRGDPNEEEKTFTVNINDDGVNIKNKSAEINIDNNNVITIDGDKVNIGNELLGKAIKSASGVEGYHNICFVTGAPIPSCSKVFVK
jgi:hypothetical protein